MNITPAVEHGDFDESKEAILQEPCEEKVEPTTFEFNDDILYAEFESFSYGFDVIVGLDVGLYAEYETFSFDPILTDFLFESHKPKFVESDAVVT